MAAYPKPTGNSGTFNNQSFVNPDNQGGLTVEEGLKYFVSYPVTQSPSNITANNFTTTGFLNVAGSSQFGGDATFIGGATITGPLIFSDNVEVDGTTTLNDTLLALSTAEIDGELTVNNNIVLNENPLNPSVKTYIQFSDNTTQDTAYNDTNAVQNDQNNTFLAPFQQTFAANASTNNANAPIRLVNGVAGEYATLYLNPSIGDVTLYSNQSDGGLTLRNQTGGSFTVNPTIDNVASFINPVNSSFSIGAPSLLVNNTNATYNSTIFQGADAALNIRNNSPNQNFPNTNFISNNSSGIPTIYLSIAPSEIDAFTTLNMNNQNIILVGTMTGANGNVIFNSNISMNVGNNILMNDNDITGANIISPTQGQAVQFQDYSANIMTIASVAGINMFQNLGMNDNVISGCASINASGAGYVTTKSPPDGDNTTKIATTAWVTTNSPSPILTNYAQLTFPTSQNFTGPILFSQIPTTTVVQTATNDATSQLATIGYVNGFFFNSTISVPLSTSFISPANTSITYTCAYYSAGYLGKSTFQLTQGGRATFMFNPQLNPNTNNTNNAFLQLVTPTWTNVVTGATFDMSSLLNGASNPILLGTWNAINTIATFQFPFNPSTLAQVNQYGSSMYSQVLYYPTASTYFQTYTAKVSIWNSFDGSQNVSLYIYPPSNGIGSQIAVQILPFSFSFG